MVAPRVRSKATKLQKTVGAVGSLLFHIVVFFFLIVPACTALNEQYKKEHPPSYQVGNYSDKLRGEGGDGLACSGYYYTGIGVVMVSKVILEVGNNTPAARAGIQVDDRVDLEWSQNEYKVGQILHLKVVRNGQTINIDVPIERICSE